MFQKSQGNVKKIREWINQITDLKGNQTIKNTITNAFGNNGLIALCGLFNDSFAYRAIQLRKMITYQGRQPDNYDTSLHSANFPQITEIELEWIIKNMSASKPAGNDKIGLEDLQLRFYKPKDVLSKILDGTLSTVHIPVGLKTEVIRSLYKTGKRKVVINYRPISRL